MKQCSQTTMFVFLLLSTCGFLNAQSPTIGLVQQDTGTTEEGYILFSPLFDSTTYLIDKCGKKVHTWHSSYRPGNSFYLLPDGYLLRPGRYFNPVFSAATSMGGIVQKIDWDGNVVWSYVISDSIHQLHHDVKQMPNGNILVMSWERKTIAEATAAGRNPVLNGPSVWSEAVFELQPVGNNQANIVWEWHLWDHLVQDFDNTKPNYGVVSSSPGKIDLNYTPKGKLESWLHLNAIDYNPFLDQIIINSPNFSELYILDHSTTTAQASTGSGGNSGRGGDILYRWGNPFAYKKGVATDQKYFYQHNARWILPGLPYENQIMVYNNGQGRTGGVNYSTVDIINPPVDGNGNYNQSLPFGPSTQSFIYNQGNPNNLYSPNISGAQMLDNGSLLVCVGASGIILEANANQNTVWKYINPVADIGIYTQGSNPANNTTFRATFIPANYPGLQGHSLIAGSIIENENNLSAICSNLTVSVSDAEVTEGNSGITDMIFTAHLSEPSSDVVKLKYKTKDRSATSPSDYISQIETISFAPGETLQYIHVSVKGDLTPEPKEKMKLKLIKAVNANIEDSIATGTIKNDDDASAITAKNTIERKEKGSLFIYPNPVGNLLNITLPVQTENYNILITDLTGRTIKQLKINAAQANNTINVSELSKGSYVIQIHSSQGMQSASFIKK